MKPRVRPMLLDSHDPRWPESRPPFQTEYERLEEQPLILFPRWFGYAVVAVFLFVICFFLAGWFL